VLTLDSKSQDRAVIINI